jgi:hypothetical protein
MKFGMQTGTSFLHEFLEGDEFLSEQPLGLDESGSVRIPNFRGAILVPRPEEKTHLRRLGGANELKRGTRI